MEPGQTLPSGSTGQVGAASGTLALVLNLCSDVRVTYSFEQTMPAKQETIWNNALSAKIYYAMLIKVIY